jgi:hypothetical protein
LTNIPHLWKAPDNSADHSAAIPAKPERKFVYSRDVRYHRKIKMENKLKVYDWSRIYDANTDDIDERFELLNETLVICPMTAFPRLKTGAG